MDHRGRLGTIRLSVQVYKPSRSFERPGRDGYHDWTLCAYYLNWKTKNISIFTYEDKEVGLVDNVCHKYCNSFILQITISPQLWGKTKKRGSFSAYGRSIRKCKKGKKVYKKCAHFEPKQGRWKNRKILVSLQEEYNKTTYYEKKMKWMKYNIGKITSVRTFEKVT